MSSAFTSSKSLAPNGARLDAKRESILPNRRSYVNTNMLTAAIGVAPGATKPGVASSRASTPQDAVASFADAFSHAPARASGATSEEHWNEVRVATSVVAGSLVPTLVDVRVNNAKEDNEQADVVTEAESEEARQVIPLHLQGDVDMNRREVLRQRFDLRRHAVVLDALQEWWETAQRSMRVKGGNCTRMSHDEYISVFTNVFAVMVEDEFDEAEARQVPAVRDWWCVLVVSTGGRSTGGRSAGGRRTGECGWQENG